MGDTKSPALQATELGLRLGTDQAVRILAGQPRTASKSSAAENQALALKSASLQNGAVGSCKQNLWLSFFFDGTGNNRAADLPFGKHSNIAKLYRVHQPTQFSKGILSVYIQGVGTYFREIGDEGGGQLGLGCGSMGEERLSFALKQFDVFLAKPLALALSPANGIKEINIAVFGFSRGAALARAFLNMLMKERCELRKKTWVLCNGKWPVRFRFLGLFDTVASVGLPMSWNNTPKIAASKGDLVGMINGRLKGFKEIRPDELAFFSNVAPIADPSPGAQHGHDSWGVRLKVHETVEEVRHFIAAHEIRNSFPVDSISTIEKNHISKPANFHEEVYPGAHSDVGGGYAPGDGGRSLRGSESLSLIPLRHMFDYASRAGVPMLAEWNDDNKADFEVELDLCEKYNRYVKEVGSFLTLGEGIKKHMALYYAWRFKVIWEKANGDKNEATLLQEQGKKFRKNEEALDKQLAGLERAEKLALLSLNSLKAAQDIQANASEDELAQRSLSVKDSDIEEANKKYDDAYHERLKVKAQKDFLPNLKNLQATLDFYDQQLLADVRSIQIALQSGSANKRRNNLRPHYRALLEAFENGFEKNGNLKDEQIATFFSKHVHDSLAGFAKDATLPSDPRVVYLGGNEKLKYANLENQNFSAANESRLA